jgi:hypothetical protein
MISLFVSDCSPLHLHFFSSPEWTGVLLWDQSSQHVSVQYPHFCVVLTSFRYANCAWIPVTIIFAIAAAVNRHNFVNVQTEPASMVQIFNFGATIAGFTITWSTLAADFTTYFHPDVPGFVWFHGCLHHGLKLQ